MYPVVTSFLTPLSAGKDQLCEWLQNYMRSPPQVCVKNYTFKSQNLTFINLSIYLVDESQNLAGNVLLSRLLVVHNARRGSQNNVTELTGGQQIVRPSLDVANLNVKSRRNDTTLVQSTVQLNDNLARSVVINVLKLANVTYQC